MKPYMDKTQTLDTFRQLVGELRSDQYAVVEAVDSALMYALYHHFGSWSKAHEALAITEETRAEWKAHWDAEAAQRGMRKKEFRERRIEELEKGRESQIQRKTLAEALAMVESNDHFVKCSTKAEVALLCGCVLADVEIIDPHTSAVVSSDDKYRLVAPLWLKVAGQTGKTVRKHDADIPDPAMLALFDLIDHLRGHQTVVGRLAEEFGVDIGGRAAERVAEELLKHARETNKVAQVVELLTQAVAETVAQRLREYQGLFEGFCQKESIGTPNLVAEVCRCLE